MSEILANFKAHQLLKRFSLKENFIAYSRNFSSTSSSENAGQDLPSPQPKIVIVGAGISGLAAADHLIRNGFQNVLISEASERFGGRVWSHRLKDCVCELGAHCINFSNSSDSLYQLAKKSGLVEEGLAEQPKYYVTNKGEIINHQLAHGAKLAFSTLISGASQKAFSKNVASSKYFLQEEGKNIAQRMFKGQAHIVERLFDSFRRDLASFIGCDLSMMSVAHLDKIATFYSNPICIREGITAIFRKLAKHIKPSQVKYGKPINYIRWNNFQDNESPFVGSADGVRFVADHIICTIPLGSLKTFASTMFDPSLPQYKVEAINKLGVGFPGKIFLEYSKDITPWFMGTIKPLWAFKNSQEVQPDWMYDITEICLVPGSNTVLEVKIGPSNEEVERCSDGEVFEKTTTLLKMLLNNNKIPFPQNILRSFWSTDPKFLGGQSYISIYSGEPHIKNIALPLHQQNSNSPVLLFAGEATSWDDFGTLEGARRSGVREAQRIINFYVNKFDHGIE